MQKATAKTTNKMLFLTEAQIFDQVVEKEHAFRKINNKNTAIRANSNRDKISQGSSAFKEKKIDKNSSK